jgi:hypothetical protein
MLKIGAPAWTKSLTRESRFDSYVDAPDEQVLFLGDAMRMTCSPTCPVAIVELPDAEKQ